LLTNWLSVKSLLFLLPYLRTYRRLLLAGLAWLVLTNILAMLIPWTLKRGIDAAERGDYREILWFAVILAAAAVLRGGTRVLSRLRYLRTARRIEVDLRRDMLIRLLAQETPFFDGQRTGDLLSRFSNDLGNIRMLAGFGVLTLANAALVYLFTLVMLLNLSPGLTLIALLPYPLMLVVVKRVSRRLLYHSTRVQEALGKVSEAVEEGVSGQAVIRAGNLFDNRCRQFDRLNDGYLECNLVLARLRALILPVMTVIGPLATLLALYFGGSRVMAGNLSLGELVAFNAYLVQLAWPTLLLGWVLTLTQRAAASMERIDLLLRLPAGKGDFPTAGPKDATPPAVRAAGLSFAYGEQPVLRGLDFDIAAGTLVGVAGATGSGKSTLLKLLAQLYPAAPGQLQVDGVDLTQLDQAVFRKRLAMVPQEGRLFSGSVRENLLYAVPDADDQELRRIADAVCLSEEVAGFAEGFATRVGEGGLALSGGQRQRVCLGRALAAGGGFWLLDDPFSHLDAATAREVWARLRPQLRGKTVFLASGRISQLEGADWVLVLDGGRLCEQGPPPELARAGGLYARLIERERLLAELEALP
jgi:ATP-binding cassette subfamily B protein